MVFEELDTRIRVIFTADNFGSSRRVNQLLLQAHHEGVLTSVSLPIRSGAFDDAVEIAKATPSLSVGLHLVVIDGKSALKPSEIVGLVDERFDFSDHLFRSALLYRYNPRLSGALKSEVDAQFRLFRTAGLTPGHVNGRHGFHLHPAVFQHIERHHERWGVKAVRNTHDPILTNLRVAAGTTARRVLRGLLWRRFSLRARPALERVNLKTTDSSFGGLAGDRFDEAYVLTILNELHPGTFEFYCEPDGEDGAAALEALLSPKVKEAIRERGIELIRHTDL